MPATRPRLCGIGDEGRFVLDAGIGVAVAEFSRTERVEHLGVGRDLGRAKRLYTFRDRLIIHRSAKAGTTLRSPKAMADKAN